MMPMLRKKRLATTSIILLVTNAPSAKDFMMNLNVLQYVPLIAAYLMRTWLKAMTNCLPKRILCTYSETRYFYIQINTNSQLAREAAPKIGAVFF
jgi:hypothetical protein